jgi:hypothetical protein
LEKLTGTIAYRSSFPTPKAAKPLAKFPGTRITIVLPSVRLAIIYLMIFNVVTFMTSKLSTLEILTLEEAADYLRLSPAIVHQKASRGIIPGQSIDDHSWRFLKSAIDDWLRRGDSRSVLLSQAGIFAGDEMLIAIQEQIDIDRQQNRFEDEV